MRKWLVLLAIACGLGLPGAAVADTYSYYYFSLEWLVDASDSIIEATVVPSPYTGNPSGSKIRVKSVARVLKKVGNAGPVEGTELPCHVAAGKEHRVLLFTRPAEKPKGERVAYCVFLTADAAPKDKKVDPFTLLPCHSSAFEPLAFSHAACVAIDKGGRVLTDPDAVVRLIETRIKANPKLVSAEGSQVKCGPKVEDTDDHNLAVPVLD